MLIPDPIFLHSGSNQAEINSANDGKKAKEAAVEGDANARKREATKKYILEIEESAHLLDDVQLQSHSINDILRNPYKPMMQLRLFASKCNIWIARLDKIPTVDVDIEYVAFVNRFIDVCRQVSLAAKRMSDGLAELIEYGETDIDSGRELKRMEHSLAELEKLI